MKIKKIHIENFRAIDNLSIMLNDKINVFIGENGMGKSTVLDALSLLLSWLVLPLQRPSQSGRAFSGNDFKNGSDFSKLGIELDDSSFGDEKITWSYRANNILLQTLSSITIPNDEKKRLDYINFLRSKYEDKQEQYSLPVIMYYQITRGGKTSKEKSFIEWRRATSSIGIYDHALEGDPCFKSFMDWLRDQNELRNHVAVKSRDEWLRENKFDLMREVETLLRSIDNYKKRNSPTSTIEASYYRQRIDELRKNKNLWQKPEMFVHELFSLYFSSVNLDSNERMMEISDTIELFMFKILDFAEYHGKMTEESGFFAAVFHKSISNICSLARDEKITSDDLVLVWNFLNFTLQVSLWWTSQGCRQKIRDIMLRRRLLVRGKILNLSFVEELTNEINHIINEDISQRKIFSKKESVGLKFVNNALASMLPEYEKLDVDLSHNRRYGRSFFDVYVEKEGEKLSFDQLSTGEQTIIALVGDLARRLVMANSELKNPLEGDGVILIDEIDLHLHPRWQKKILPLLSKTFPNCQFIVTTHSPLVLSELKPRDVFKLNYDEKKQIKVKHPQFTIGLSSNEILDSVMDVEFISSKIQSLLDDVYALIEERKYQSAHKSLRKLQKESHGLTPELIKAKTYLKLCEE